MSCHAMLAQEPTALLDKAANCEFIKINDQLVVHAGDYVLDNNRIIDIAKTFLAPTNAKNTYVVPNPCATISTGYKGATIIERKQKMPIVSLSLLVDDVKKQYPGFLNYEVFINGTSIENYAEYDIELSNQLSLKTNMEYKAQEKIRCVITITP